MMIDSDDGDDYIMMIAMMVMTMFDEDFCGDD